MKMMRILLAVLVVATVMETTGARAADQAAIRNELVQVVARFAEPVIMPPGDGKAWWLEVHGEVQGRSGHLLLAWDGQARHFVKLSIPELAQFSAAFGSRESWLFLPGKDKLFTVKHDELGAGGVFDECRVWPIVRSQVAAIAGAAAIYPLPENLKLEQADSGEITTAFGTVTVRVTRDEKGLPTVKLTAGDYSGSITCRAWERRPVAEFDTLFAPPPAGKIKEVDIADLRWMFATVADFLSEYFLRRVSPQIVPDPFRDLPREQGQVVVRLTGSPEEMGTQHGSRLKPAIHYLVHRVVHGAGFVSTVQSGEWFPARLQRLWETQRKQIPERVREWWNGEAGE